MKKTVIIILTMLPIFLVITISFAGRILSLYQHVSVERIRFVDETNRVLEDNYLFTLGVGEERQAYVRIFPELATNKKITYISDKENICTIGTDGVIKGVSYGLATIIAKSEDGSRVDMLSVKVTQDRPIGVSLPYDEIDLVIGEKKRLEATVEAPVAVNKSVIYTSSNPDIAKVDGNGWVEAVSVGQVVITVTTVDGELTDTCIINCFSGEKAMYFDVSGDENFVETEHWYNVLITEINLFNYLQVDVEKIIIDNIRFRIKMGDTRATLVGDKLTITGKGLITIVAYVGDQSNPDYQSELKLYVQ